MISTPSTRPFWCLSAVSPPGHRQTRLPAAQQLRFTTVFTQYSHHPCHLRRRCFHASTLRCCATGHRPDWAQDNQDRPSRPFPYFLGRQAFVAVGALLLAVLVVRPLAKCWSEAHKPVPDALPAAVWLPRSTSDLPAKQQADCQNNHQARTFAAISSSIPATSSRLLRISDACLMQLTVALQQVDTKCMLQYRSFWCRRTALAWLSHWCHWFCTADDSCTVRSRQ